MAISRDTNGLIDKKNASGLNLPEFFRRRGLSRGTMQGWV
jgi:hypothetical protein